MEAKQVGQSQITASSTHPLLLVAATSVTLLSLTGVGVLTGWLPSAGAHDASPAQFATAPAVTPTPVQKNITVPQKKTEKLARSDENTPVRIYREAPAPAATTPTIAVLPAPTNAAVPTSGTVTPAPTYAAAAPTPATCSECGVVESVREMAVKPKGSGAGMVAGGLVGGLIANKIGKGSARSIATLLGAAGGAYAGNYIEKSVREGKRYEVLVRFDDSNTRTFSSESLPPWQSGDRVKLQNGMLTMGSGSPGGRPDGNPAMI